MNTSYVNIHGGLVMSEKWSKFKKATKKTFEEAEQLISIMLEDRTVPRNIKRKAQEALNHLHQNDSPAVLASNAISYVDDLSQDPNCPYHTRTLIYKILSLLETVKD